MMNNKDSELIYEAYLSEKVEELSDDHLATIRANFYPREGNAMFDEVIEPALKRTFDNIDSGGVDPDLWQHTNLDIEGGQLKALENHLLELKHGKIGKITRQGSSWLKNKATGATNAVKKIGNKYTLQSPIRKKY
jgi:hypothetical protein